MKNIELIKVNFAGAEVLTREQLKRIKGRGSQCGSYPNCTAAPCVATSGPCKDLPGTCGKTIPTQTSTFAVVC